jgi:hypothetical protein
MTQHLCKCLRDENLQEDEIRSYAREAADALERLNAANAVLAEEIADYTKENVVLTATLDGAKLFEQSHKHALTVIDRLESERDDLGDDLAQAKRYIETLTDERDTYIELWRKALIERDAYQIAADKQAREHKVERDALSIQIDALEKDAARYRWLRSRIKVSKQQAVSGSVRDALEVKVGCSFIDSQVAQGSPAAYSIEQSEKLDAAIDAAKESKT